MGTLNRDLSKNTVGFAAQLESGASNSYPIYRSTQGKTAYVKKITVTNNTAVSGTFDIGLYETSFIPGGNVFSAVSKGPASATTTAASSTDGITWTLRTMPTAAYWSAEAYGNGVFVAVSTNSSYIAATSTDGITWALRTLPASDYWSSVTYGGGKFIAVGSTAYYGVSTDGTTWTYVAADNSGLLQQASTAPSVTYGNGAFVGFSASASAQVQQAVRSTDGITWTAGNLPKVAPWWGITYGNGLFVAITNATTAAATSTDGITWAIRTLPASPSWTAIAYGNGTFAVISSSSTTAASSTDGITWTLRTMPTAVSWSSLTFGNNVFVATSNSNTTAAASSTDGITWTTRTMPAAYFGGGVAYPQRSDFSSDNYLYKSVTLAANTTQSISYEVMVPPNNEIRARSTVPMQITVMGEV